MAAQREAERAAEAAKNAEAADSCPLTLPELQGSEKQRAWAANLRNKLIADLIRRGIKWDAVMAALEGDTPSTDVARQLVTDLTQPAAKWWIDNRGKSIGGNAAVIGNK
jgi:hypothetical protein